MHHLIHNLGIRRYDLCVPKEDVSRAIKTAIDSPHIVSLDEGPRYSSLSYNNTFAVLTLQIRLQSKLTELDQLVEAKWWLQPHVPSHSSLPMKQRLIGRTRPLDLSKHLCKCPRCRQSSGHLFSELVFQPSCRELGTRMISDDCCRNETLQTEQKVFLCSIGTQWDINRQACRLSVP